MNRILITIATIALVILGYAMITQSTEPMSCERIISEGVETGEIRLVRILGQAEHQFLPNVNTHSCRT